MTSVYVRCVTILINNFNVISEILLIILNGPILRGFNLSEK